MTVALWRIGTDTSEYAADDLSGAGAKRTGGRWNRPGRPVAYVSTSISLAALETLVHLNAGSLPLNRYVVRIDVDDALWAQAMTFDATTHVGWDAEPAGCVSLDAGDAWLASSDSLLLRVPSVVVPEEMNVLINPMHPEASNLKAAKIRRFLYDARLRGTPP